MALVLAVAASIKLLFLWNNFTGKDEWLRTEADLRGRGEKLTLVELAPPPVSNDVNFFADPMWDELHPSGSGANPGEPSLPKGQRKLDVFNRPATDPHFQKLAADYPEFSFTGSTVQQNLLKLAIKEEKAGTERRQRAAEFILAALQKAEPALTRVEKLAQRPESNFQRAYADGLKMPQPHITYLLTLGQAFQLRASAEITLGEAEASHRDVLTLQRLSQMQAKEPTLIPQLVRISLEGMATHAMVEGIKAHLWSEAELTELEKILVPIDFIPSLILALRGERGCFNQTAEELRKSSQKRFFKFSSSPADKVLALSHDQAFTNHLIQDWIDEVAKAPEKGLTPRSMSDAELQALKKNPLSKIRNILSLLFLPSIPEVGRKFAWTQDQIRMTRVACALERYRLRHGGYPDTLDTLAPDFLPVLPVDTVTLGPIRYRTDEKEGFLLWTPGWNEKDDNGKPADRKTNDGDWIWGKPL